MEEFSSMNNIDARLQATERFRRSIVCDTMASEVINGTIEEGLFCHRRADARDGSDIDLPYRAFIESDIA